MNETSAPPVVTKVADNSPWYIYLLILLFPIALVVVLALTHFFFLPRTNLQLAGFLFLELLVWGSVFYLAFKLTKMTKRRLYLQNDTFGQHLGFGFLNFVGAWAVLALVTYLQFLVVDSKWLWSAEEKLFEFAGGRTIAQHPTFSLIVCGLAALIAAITEELWRVGMVRGIRAIFPETNEQGGAAFIAIVAVSLIYGIGHCYLGLFGVEATMVIGFVLGMVLFYRRSYWELVVAHFLIDAVALGTVISFAVNPSMLNADIVHGGWQSDLPTVRHLLNIGGDPNAASGSDGTVLAAAARQSDTGLVKLLLDRGADPNIKDDQGETPLIAASEGAGPENVRQLIARGAKLDWQDARGFTALRAAAQYNRYEAAKILVEAGANPNLADKDQITPLEAAQKLNYHNVITLLEEKTAKPSP